MRSLTLVPAGRAGAIYDVAVTAPFATPWTAALMLSALAWMHEVLNLPGDAPPDFEAAHMVYVVLFGIVTTMWGVVRVLWPVPLLIAADTVGRAAFSLTFIWALLNGFSFVVVGFLVLELTWLVAQGLGVRKTLKADREAHVLAA
jgi:hypothetical protein